MPFRIYRLHIRKIFAVPSSGGIDTRYYDRDYSPTNVTFKARTDKEALRKACKFWLSGNFGMGSITVKQEGESIHA